MLDKQGPRETLRASGAVFELDRQLLDADCFIERYWGRRHFNGALPADLFARLLSSSELDEVLSREAIYRLNTCLIRSPDPSKNRQIVTLGDAAECLSTGLTLQIRNLERFLTAVHPLYQIARSLEKASGNPLDSITLFITPSGGQALNRHSDSTEIITIQLYGSKKWKIVQPGPETQQVDEVTICPGNVLYLPAGIDHWAVAQESTSISAALIYRPVRFDQFLRYLAQQPATRALLGKTIPCPIVATRADLLAEELGKFFSEFSMALASADLNQFKEFLLRSASDSLPAAPMFSMSTLVAPLAAHARLVRTPSLEPSFSTKGDEIELRLPGGASFRAPYFLEDEVRWLLSIDRPFVASEISTKLSPEDCLRLVDKLRHFGIIQPVDVVSEQ